jgi:hypothetical protein
MGNALELGISIDEVWFRVLGAKRRGSLHRKDAERGWRAAGHKCRAEEMWGDESYSVSAVLFTQTFLFTLGNTSAIHTDLLREIFHKLTVMYTLSIYKIELS